MAFMLIFRHLRSLFSDENGTIYHCLVMDLS